MNQFTDEEKLYEEAREIVEAKKGFYIHFIIYVIMSGVMYLVWRFTWTGYRWYIWPILGWGVGVLFHFLAVFFFSESSDWDKKAIEKEVERLKRKG
ncbi:MAG: hypothetical protein EHM72_16135 [Calditrichaeota bacterium]|nr:MAG: hypothetical protein EHM72_16135 [Calditrichota bacterium]